MKTKIKITPTTPSHTELKAGSLWVPEDSSSEFQDCVYQLQTNSRKDIWHTYDLSGRLGWQLGANSPEEAVEGLRPFSGKVELTQ